MLSDYDVFHPSPQLRLDDLRFDFMRGYVKFPDITRSVDIGVVATDPLQDIMVRLAAANSSLAAALRYEALDGFSPSPPLAGGGINAELTAEGYASYRRFSGELINVPLGLAPAPLVIPANNEVGFVEAPPDSVENIPILSVGLTEFRSVRALCNNCDNWEDWKAVIRAELDSVIGKKMAIAFKSASEFQAARTLFGDHLKIVHLVTHAVVKHNAQGEVLCLKWRLTAGDRRKNAHSLFNGATYSGAVDDALVRFLANLTLGRPNG